MCDPQSIISIVKKPPSASLEIYTAVFCPSFVLCMQNDNQICQTEHFKMFVLNFIVKKQILLLQISVFTFPFL